MMHTDEAAWQIWKPRVSLALIQLSLGALLRLRCPEGDNGNAVDLCFKSTRGVLGTVPYVDARNAVISA